MRITLFFLFSLVVIQYTWASDTLIAKKSLWKYYDDSLLLPINWRSTAYNDSTWKEGYGEFGFGEGDENTVINYGTDVNNKRISSYYRKKILVPMATQYDSYTFSIYKDDGIVLYINGNEVFRYNIYGSVTPYTLAKDASNDGKTALKITLNSSLFVDGVNMVAAEIHQSSAYTDDASFDLELIGNTHPVITRGPYLQKVSPTSATIRWQTSTATNSLLSYINLQETAIFYAGTNTPSINHEVTLQQLNPKSLYYYKIKTTEPTFTWDSTQYFITFPPKESTPKTRIWATGDCGNNSLNQFQNMQQQQAYLQGKAADIWLLLGDNAYENGTEYEFQHNFFNVFEPILKHTPLYPAPGNHDYAGNDDRQNDHKIPYYDIFSLPENAEIGGVPSHTEAYYSFDYGNIHFLSLDSYGREDSATRLYDTLGAQVQWIKKDLAATKQKWKIAYWHHPPYTKGSHNSDTEDELILIRQNLLQILERNGVDLVLCGHSHSYERSYLLNGYYSDAASFDGAVHAKSVSTAKYDGSPNSCPYTKEKTGTVYIVSGSAGKVGGSSLGFPHNAMYYSDVWHGGSLMLEIEGNRLDAKWLCADGEIRDNFTLMKDANIHDTLPVHIGDEITLTASWLGNYIWHTGETKPNLEINITKDTLITVTDEWSCMQDTFFLQLPLSYPVSLQDFSARVVQENQVLLEWQTTKERNFDHFDIERSTDNVYFTRIASLPRKSGANSPKPYSFTDKQALNNRSYYRLRSLDTQGAGFTSPSVTVYLNENKPFFIEAYPNPLTAKDILFLKILSPDSDKHLSVEILDSTGKSCLQKELIGTSFTPLHLENLAEGVYIVRVYGEGLQWSEKVIVGW